MCPRSSDPFYIVSYNIKWATTSWTYSTCRCWSLCSSSKGPNLFLTLIPSLSLSFFSSISIYLWTVALSDRWTLTARPARLPPCSWSCCCRRTATSGTAPAFTTFREFSSLFIFSSSRSYGQSVPVVFFLWMITRSSTFYNCKIYIKRRFHKILVFLCIASYYDDSEDLEYFLFIWSSICTQRVDSLLNIDVGGSLLYIKKNLLNSPCNE